MSSPDKQTFINSPIEVARDFLRDNFSDANFTGPRESNPPYDIGLIANLTWYQLQREPIEDRTRFLAERPVTFVALVIARFASGLAEDEERFGLHNSASNYLRKIQTELISHQLIGRFYYGTLDLLRDTRTKPPQSIKDYIRELEGHAKILQDMQDALMVKVN